MATLNPPRLSIVCLVTNVINGRLADGEDATLRPLLPLKMVPVLSKQD